MLNINQKNWVCNNNELNIGKIYQNDWFHDPGVEVFVQGCDHNNHFMKTCNFFWIFFSISIVLSNNKNNFHSYIAAIYPFGLEIKDAVYSVFNVSSISVYSIKLKH